MKIDLSSLRAGALFGLGALLTTFVWIGAYAAYSTLSVNTNDILSTSKWNELVSYTVPPGAVMAFNLTTCPVNWSQADGNGGRPDLRGQFIRGLNTFDSGATTRSDGKQDTDTRSLAGWQADIFKSHNHPPGNTQNGFMSNTYPDGGIGINWAGAGFIWVGYQMATTGDRWGLETRPRNVALIYCVKN